MAESLRPGTDAITANTLEWNWEGRQRGRHFVRYKDVEGNPFHLVTDSWDAANIAFEKFMADMRSKTKDAIRPGTWPRQGAARRNPESTEGQESLKFASGENASL